jgi:hypothetical protein
MLKLPLGDEDYPNFGDSAFNCCMACGLAIFRRRHQGAISKSRAPSSQFTRALLVRIRMARSEPGKDGLPERRPKTYRTQIESGRRGEPEIFI